CACASRNLFPDPVFTEPSGFPELDGAAVKVAKANRYLPGTDGGQPMAESCVKFKVKFVIKAEYISRPSRALKRRFAFLSSRKSWKTLLQTLLLSIIPTVFRPCG